MADENKTISQIKIGNYFYNIRDAQVRDVLNNITNNVVTIHNFYCSDWEAVWNLRKNNEFTSADYGYQVSNRGSLRFYINAEGKLYYYFVGSDNTNLVWQGGLVSNTPTIVNQCAILLQYRFRLSMPRTSYVSSQVLRKPLSTVADINSEIGTAQNFSAMVSTKKTCVKVGDFTSLLHSNNYWFDRLVRTEGQIKGYDYKLALNDYYQSGSARGQFTGISSTQLLIAQGTTTERLFPEEELIPETVPNNDSDSDDPTS